jgi:hypothetical protein
VGRGWTVAGRIDRLPVTYLATEEVFLCGCSHFVLLTEVYDDNKCDKETPKYDDLNCGDERLGK